MYFKFISIEIGEMYVIENIDEQCLVNSFSFKFQL